MDNHQGSEMISDLYLNQQEIFNSVLQKKNPVYINFKIKNNNNNKNEQGCQVYCSSILAYT